MGSRHGVGVLLSHGIARVCYKMHETDCILAVLYTKYSAGQYPGRSVLLCTEPLGTWILGAAGNHSAFLRTFE